MPLHADRKADSKLDLATNRKGEALLIAWGGAWVSDGGAFRPITIGSKVVTRVAGADNGFWLLTNERAILHLSDVNASLRHVAEEDSPLTAWAAGSGGELWYATQGGRLWSLRPDGQPEELKIQASADVTAVFADVQQQVWFATADGKLGRHLAGETDWFEAGGAVVTEIAADADGNLLLARPQADVARTTLLTQPRELRSNLRADFAHLVLNGLAGSVQDIEQDSLGGTWVSAGRTGAFRLQGITELPWPTTDEQTQLTDLALRSSEAARAAAGTPVNQAQNITNFSAMPGARLSYLNTARGLPNNYISCGVSDGVNMWFGTGYQYIGPENESGAGSGVIRWDHRHAVLFNAGIPSQTVQGCAHDPGTGALWFGTTGGVARLVNGSFTTFLPGVVVLDIIVQGSDVWVATLANGVYRLSAVSGASTAQIAIGGARVTSLVFDNGGTLWAGTSAGLHRFDGAAFVRESTGSIQANDYVMDVEVDESNNVWAAVWNKAVFRRAPGGVTNQFGIGPLFNGIRRVYAVRRDNFGNLWFGHGNFGAFSGPATGVTFLPAAQVSSGAPAFQAYSQTGNGLPSNQVLSLAPETDGMWLGTPGGGVWRIGGPFTMTGFPVSMQSFPAWTSPLLVDLDNDRDLEIVAGDDSGRIYAFRPDGSALWTYDTRTSLPVPAGASRGPIAIHSSPAAGDVDGDGEVEIVVGLGGLTPASYGGVLILSRTGAFKRLLTTLDIVGPGASLASDGLPEHVFATPVLANVDGDPELEIMVGSFDHFLYAWNGDGSFIYQRDDDGDGRFDEDYLGDTTPTTPFISSDDAPGVKGVDDDKDGQVDEGPFTSDDDEDGLVDEDYWEWPQNARDTVYASAVVADLNGDGQKEIVFGHDYTGGPNQEFARGGVLRVFGPTGAPAPGFPRGNLEQVIWSSPIAVDLDNDGTYELMHGSGFEMDTAGNTTADQLIGRLVYAWRSNGQPFRTCAGNSAPGCFATTEGRGFASFAVGDLDNDGSPELVIATLPLRNKAGQTINSNAVPVPLTEAVGQQLYAFRADGSLLPGFPVRPNPDEPGISLFGSPILGDVNNDGFLDIILNVRFGLMVFDRFARVLPGMGRWENLQEDNLTREMNGTPAIADIDLDGNLELVWLTPTAGGATGAVHVVKLGPANGAYQRSWPQWRRGINRNAIFGPIISVTQAWENAGNVVVRAQALIGRAAATSVVVDLSAIGGPAAQAMVPGANYFYEHVTSVAALPPGRYHLPIRITDGLGRTDTQTAIFVKRGGSRQLAVSAPTLSFGTVRQGETGVAQLGVVNTGTDAVTIANIASNSAEFFLASPTSYPQIVQAGQTLIVNVRYRPGSAAGARNATLSISSNDAAASTRTVALTGSTPGGANGCNVTLTKLTPSNTVTGVVGYQGETGSIRLTTSPAGCAWTASTDVRWLQIYPVNGVGNTDIGYTVFPNSTLRPRTGRVLANGTVLPVNQGQAGSDENERFIAAMYFAAFGRYPNAQDLQYHIGTIGGDRAVKAADFFTSTEFNLLGRFISGIYLGVLGRLPEYSGWLFQRNAVASAGGGAQQSLARNFLQSPEFLIRNPSLTNEQFIRFLYTNILGRQPSQTEVNRQLANLGTGDIASRAQKATEFLNVPEYNARTGPELLATLMYFVFYQRDPTAEELTALKARIPAGATRTQLIPIIREFLESSEYRAILI